jgi:RNA polymerase-binding transcription factor DksA
MTDDKIEEIRARHRKRSEIDQSGCYRLDGFTFMGSLAQSQEDVATLLAEVERLRAAARNALNELNCIEEDGGHRCIRCDSEIDEGHHVRLALRNALEAKP